MTRNRAAGLILSVVIAAMVGMAYASVPLYRMFCAATGYEGTVQIGGTEPMTASAQTITVHFDANVNGDLPWSFQPAVANTTVHLGEDRLAYYEARNRGRVPVTGVALYNVTPATVGKYFHKTACFCFNSQTLAAGQSMRFPLSFYVDPAIATDPETRDIRQITLSYTFYRSLDDAARNGALAQAGPHAGALN